MVFIVPFTEDLSLSCSTLECTGAGDTTACSVGTALFRCGKCLVMKRVGDQADGLRLWR